MVAYHDNDVRQLLTDLCSFYETQLNPQKAATQESASELADSSANAIVDQIRKPADEGSGGEENFVDELAREPESSDAGADSEAEIQDSYYDMARGIKVGTWVEFRHGEDRDERGKLSWESPISSKFLFVNRKGLKVADKTIWALASELRHQRAMLLEDVPLFDRALDAIVERLKSSVGQSSDSLHPTGEGEPQAR